MAERVQDKIDSAKANAKLGHGCLASCLLDWAREDSERLGMSFDYAKLKEEAAILAQKATAVKYEPKRPCGIEVPHYATRASDRRNDRNYLRRFVKEVAKIISSSLR